MRTEQPHTIVAGRYELAEELGRSSAGASWRATDTVLHRSVVVELLHPDLVTDPSFADRFARQTRAVASLEHPGLARLLDAGSDGGVYFVVREDVEGRNLRELLDAEGPLPVERAVEVTSAVLDAVSQIHGVGVLQLDLRPDDVVVEPGGGTRLCSAGIAGMFAMTDGPVGPPSPERVGAEHPPGDQRPDVRAAGELLFELLTGAPPGTSPSLRSVRRDVSRAVDAVVSRALSPDPDTRYRTARDLRAALAEAASRLHAPEERIEASPDEVRRTSLFRTWLAVPLVVVVLALAAGVAGLSFGRLELGGPVGIRLKEEEPSPSPSAVPRVLTFRSVATFDPFGDDHENDSGVDAAIDGDPSTAWKSENYFDGELHKPGVGLLFDLGTSQTVTGFRMTTPSPGFSFRVLVGDDPRAMATQRRGTSYVSGGDGPVALDPPGRGRYVLLWITSVVPVEDGDRAEVAEFRVLGLPR